MEMETGRVLAGQDIHERLAMASTTKIMTALLTLEQPDLDTYFTVDAKAILVEGSSMGLLPGDQVTLRGLAVGMLLALRERQRGRRSSESWGQHRGLCGNDERAGS